MVNQIGNLPTPKFEAWSEKILDMGQMILGALTDTVLVIAIMVYFMVDGSRTCKWITAFFPSNVQTKINQTFEELMPVISAYFVGQAITSILCSIFVYILLTSLQVPAALILAVLAGIFDILPVIGFFLSVIPAALFALTVSGQAALIVFGLYCVYHAIENYLIIPWVYGNRLRLSGLVVLLSILAGVALAGILGAIVILPVVASYPIIEKIWLKRVVHPDQQES
jgi:predicted PurR-regulated permease PerM